MTRTSYQSIDLKFPVRAIAGRAKVTSIEAVDGRKITRITDGASDFYICEGHGCVPGVEIDASNVAAGVRKNEAAVRGRGGKAKAEDEG